MTVPGITAVHAIVTPTCRANRGTNGAFEEAVSRLRAEYLALQQFEANVAASFHLVLTVDREEGRQDTPEGGPHAR